MTSIRRIFFGLAVSSILLLSAGAAFATAYKYTSIDYPGAIGTYPYGINDSGQIVGCYSDGSGNDHCFLLAGGTYSSFDCPCVIWAYPCGINASGRIVGCYSDGSDSVHGFLLAGGTYTSFDCPGAIWTYPFGINTAGQIVGWYLDASGNRHAFRATPIRLPSFLMLLLDQ